MNAKSARQRARRERLKALGIREAQARCQQCKIALGPRYLTTETGKRVCSTDCLMDLIAGFERTGRA